MRLTATITSAVFLLAFSGPHARAVDAGMVVSDPVAEEVGVAREVCGEDLAIDDSFANWVDLNGDGHIDVVINHGGALCMGTVSFFCGSGGCSGSVYIALGDGRFELTGFPPEIEPIDWEGEAGVQVVHHGTYCGRVGANWCHEIWVWTDGMFEKRWQDY
ncbi:MAG: hypothetical protein AAFX39_11765 [Pseudomonadota bacterium]